MALKATDPVYSLSAEAREILIGGSKATDGFVHFINYDGGFQVMTNEKQFVAERIHPQEAAKWKAGFDELLKGGLLEATHQESVYRVTKKGYDVAKELSE